MRHKSSSSSSSSSSSNSNSHHGSGNSNQVVPSLRVNWTLCMVFFVGFGSVSSALPAKPKQLSQDCTTLIVTNERRLASTGGGGGGGGPVTAGCGERRQGKKLPAAVSRLFREEVDDYPEDEIRQLLKQTPNDIKDLYNVLNTPLDPNANLTERVAFYPNSDDDAYVEREESVCRTVTRNIYPREANLHNSLVYIPNNQDFMQVIQAEICQHPDQECSYLRDNLPYGMVSACVQKYSYKKLLYMDPLDKRMASDLFRYPSCCVCTVRTLPLDLRSNQSRNHSTGHNSRLAASSSSTTTAATVSFPTPSLPLPSSSSLSDSNTDDSHSATNAAPYTSPGNGLGQPSDRSQDSESPSPSPPTTRRHSKRIRGSTNQTLVLSDDKVYAPAR
jgi:hypothetical protein